jgi:hypothetical protein
MREKLLKKLLSQTLSSKFLNFIYMKFLGREHERGAFYKKLLSRYILIKLITQTEQRRPLKAR